MLNATKRFSIDTDFIGSALQGHSILQPYPLRSRKSEEPSNHAKNGY